MLRGPINTVSLQITSFLEFKTNRNVAHSANFCKIVLLKEGVEFQIKKKMLQINARMMLINLLSSDAYYRDISQIIKFLW